MEVEDWFGEFELFDETPRKWSVMAKSKCVVYQVPKTLFLRLFDKKEIRKGFLKATIERISCLEKAERECGRVLRRNGRVKNKMKNVLASAKESIQMSINVSKQKKGKGGWHENMIKL